MRCICIQKILGLMTAAALAACQNPTAGTGGAIAPVSACKIFTAVLGTGQDAGKPQIGVHSSPDMKHQLYWLDQLDDGRGFALDGIFLTPLKNIDIQPLEDGGAVPLSERLSVTPFAVPHRGEYTETVGYRISSASASVIYLPDIDSWTEWEAQDSSMGGSLLQLVQDNDRLYLDATFFSGAELPGRDMSLIPHPTISTSMAELTRLHPADRVKVHFIHMNHSNPAHDRNSAASREIAQKGFNVAQSGEVFCLD